MNAPLQLAGYRQTHAPRLFLVREDVERELELEPETVTDCALAHERIVALGVERASRERDVCRWLLAAERLGVAARNGYGRLSEYAERVLGLSARQTEERLRVGRELGRLPLLDDALARGQVSFTVVRELTRAAMSETEAEWLDFARGKTSREVEKAVAGLSKGDRPGQRPDPRLLKHRLSFEVGSETMALFRDLQAAVRADLGSDASLDEVLGEIARRALGGPTDAGRASYQVAVSRCDSCKLARIDAAGESHPVDEVTAERMECDAQRIGKVDGPRVGAARATQTIPPATRRQVMRRDKGTCAVPGCRHHRFVDVHHVTPRSEGGGHEPEGLMVLCGKHHQDVHAGRLVVEGTATAGFSFRHADGAAYGEAIRPADIEMARKVFEVLRSMRIEATRARQLIDAVQREGAPEELGAFVRAALKAQ